MCERYFTLSSRVFCSNCLSDFTCELCKNPLAGEIRKGYEFIGESDWNESIIVHTASELGNEGKYFTKMRNVIWYRF